MLPAELNLDWIKRKPVIRKRLAEFDSLLAYGRGRIFPELAFCLCTPQSSGQRCGEAVKELERTGLLWNGTPEQIAPVLRNWVRFHHTKAKRIVHARERFDSGFLAKLRGLPQIQARELLLEEIPGLGYTRKPRIFFGIPGTGLNSLFWIGTFSRT